MKIYDKLVNLDRRIIYLCIGLSVLIPILLKLTFPEYPVKMTQDLYDTIDRLPKGSKILYSIDYDPSTDAELRPMFTAFLRHNLLRDHKIYLMALIPMGQQLSENAINSIIKVEFPDKVYGKDYVNLGFKAGAQGVIAVILSNMKKLYSADVNNTSVDDIPMMSDIKNLSSFDLLINVNAGFPGTKEWIQFGTDPANLKIASGTTAVGAPGFYPYYPKQLVGLLGGIKGVAEYESLLMKNFEKYADRKYHIGIIRWGPQTVAHIVIVIFIIFGNVMFFIDKRKKKVN